MKPAFFHIVATVCIACCLLSGCRRDDPAPQSDPAVTPEEGAVETGASGAEAGAATSESETTAQPLGGVIELNADALLAMRLDEQEAREGWVRLFDGHTMYGWLMAGNANWMIEDQTLVADSGEKSLLCTTLPWRDFELSLEFRADADTNSGIFLRTPLVPEDPATDCYELNIAPADNPFPTASLVGRQRVEPEDLSDWDANRWHRYLVRVEGDTVAVHLDGEELYSYTDPNPLPANRIGLQYNAGRIAFRDIRLRPLGLQSLLPEDRTPSDTVAGWKHYPDMEGSFRINDEGNLHVRGGRTQLETEGQYADFSLLATLKTAGPGQNSGIFFRCIPGETMNGYECQIDNDMIDENPLLPEDTGTGGIFRRQEARIIAAGHGEWFSLLLVAHGPDMAAWVNGLQVSEWHDDREPHANPREGQRLEAGTIMLQGHDPGTDVEFAEIRISPRP